MKQRLPHGALRLPMSRLVSRWGPDLTRHAGMEQLGFALARESYASCMRIAVILNIVVVIIIIIIFIIVMSF